MAFLIFNTSDEVLLNYLYKLATGRTSGNFYKSIIVLMITILKRVDLIQVLNLIYQKRNLLFKIHFRDLSEKTQQNSFNKSYLLHLLLECPSCLFLTYLSFLLIQFIMVYNYLYTSYQ